MKKLNILFVDDELNVLLGYKRTFYSMKDEWEFFMANSGLEAMAIIAENDIDIIISDMRMPGMDGSYLLKLVKDKYPQIIRLILSGFSDKEDAMKASGLAHQVLAKPTSVAEIKNCISNILKLRNSLPNGNILSIITGTDKLPSNPVLYSKLNEILNSPSISVKTIAEIVSHDPTMTAKILQMVNSAFFGLPHRIIDPFQAVSFLGLDIVKSLVIFVNIFIEYKGDHYSELNNFWEHSLYVGKLAEAICIEEKCEKKICETALIAGLLHDIGKLAMNRILSYFDNVKHEMCTRNLNFVEAEYLLWGISHSEAGAYLLTLWGLPKEIAEVLSFHHYPLKSGIETFNAISAVYFAECIKNNYPVNIEYLEKLNLVEKFETFKKINI